MVYVFHIHHWVFVIISNWNNFCVQCVTRLFELVEADWIRSSDRTGIHWSFLVIAQHGTWICFNVYLFPGVAGGWNNFVQFSITTTARHYFDHCLET